MSATPPRRPGPPGSSPPDPGTRRAHALWRAASPAMFAATLLFGLIAAIGGPIVLYQLIVRGVRESRPSWLVLGIICAIPWLLVVYAAIKRAIRGPAPEPPASAATAAAPDERGRNGTSGGNHIGG